jgi:hypothetical protein
VSFRELDAGHIVRTLERLSQRIEERFPGSGLGNVARDLIGLARDCASEAELLGKPNWPVRIGAVALGVLMLLLAAWAVAQLGRGVDVAGSVGGVAELLQATEAVINEIVLMAAGIFFLVSLEARLKRRTALQWLHQLRSVAHIVDMHQLTKDPDRILRPQQDTQSSPTRAWTRDELGRYLDYCSELLSLCSKTAALFAQRFNDALVLQSVNEIEDLTSGLSRKIWQKITLLSG